MQSSGFDIWAFLLSLLGFLGTCNLSSPSTDVQESKLSMPTPDETDGAAYGNVATKLTLFLLKNGKTYSYEGLNANSGAVHKEKEVRDLILAAKKNLPSSGFVVVIKPTGKADYRSTAAVLDEPSIAKMHRYSIGKLSSEEKEKPSAKDLVKY